MKGKTTVVSTYSATPVGFYLKLVFLHIILLIDVYCQMHISVADLSEKTGIKNINTLASVGNTIMIIQAALQFVNLFWCYIIVWKTFQFKFGKWRELCIHHRFIILFISCILNFLLFFGFAGLLMVWL